MIWSSFTPFWDPALMAFMQQKYGAVSVTEVLSRWRGQANWVLDPDDPIGNLAYRTQLAPGNCQYSPSHRLGRSRSSSRPASSRRTGRSSTTTGAASRLRASARSSATN